MAYMRGEPYVWSDGDHLHIWSESGMDQWRTNERYAENPKASGVQIPETLADELVVMRFAEMLKLGLVSSSIDRALANWGGNFGCAALEDLAESIKRQSGGLADAA